jgi:hypothetical protein
MVIASGLASRSKEALSVPPFIAEYAGDTLWALMIFLILGWAFPKQSTRRNAIGALAFCYLIEASQLYQAEWLNSLRATVAGQLILGSGFLWSDLWCYLAGVSLGMMGERLSIARAGFVHPP